MIDGLDNSDLPSSFSSIYSGYIGLQPWTANPSRKEENFLWQLKNRGLITHMTFSFFVELEDRSSPHSNIKFGGMDEIGL